LEVIFILIQEYSNQHIIDEAVDYLKQIRDEGRLIIGIPQHGLFPDELVWAAGMFPLHMTLGGLEEQEIGDEYLSPTTCPFGRATIGFLVKKHKLYSFIDYLIISTFCNGAQNIGNYASYFDIPVIEFLNPHTQSASALEFYTNEIRSLRSKLEKIKGEKISDNVIINSIKLFNSMRLLLFKINEYRSCDPSKISGTELFYLVHKSILLGPEIMIPQLRNIINELANSPPITNSSRVFLTGTGICLGDNLYEIIENDCGGLIVGDDLWSGYDYFWSNAEISGDPIKNLANKYLLNNLCGRMIPDPRAKHILNLFRKCRAKGFIYHILKYCDSYSGLKFEFKNMINKHDIPILELERDFTKTNIGQIKTRIEAFMEMIK